MEKVVLDDVTEASRQQSHKGGKKVGFSVFNDLSEASPPGSPANSRGASNDSDEAIRKKQNSSRLRQLKLLAQNEKIDYEHKPSPGTNKS